MNFQPSTSADSGGEQEKHSPISDDDADLRELTKEYESEDSVGVALKSEQHAKLLNKIFRSKMGETTLKKNWRKLRENTRKRDLLMAKMQQALVKGIIPIAQVVDTATLNLEEIQLVKEMPGSVILALSCEL